jgi:drug/metabolite transporter (DMT)-like permease
MLLKGNASQPLSYPSLLAIHCAVLLFGFAGLFSKWLSLPAVVIVLGRTLFAALFLFMLLLLRRQSFRLQQKAFRLLLISGILLAGHWFAFFRSIQVSTVAVGLLAFASFPIFVVLLEPLAFKEKFQRRYVFLALLTLAGIYLLVPRFSWQDASVRGILWGLIAGFTFAVLTLLNRFLTRQHSSLLIAFYQDLFAALSLLPLIFFVKFSSSPQDLGLLLILGIFCTAIAHSLFIRGLRRVRAQTASIIALLEPVYGIALAFLLLGEKLLLHTILGGMIILVVSFFATLKPVG